MRELIGAVADVKRVGLSHRWRVKAVYSDGQTVDVTGWRWRYDDAWETARAWLSERMPSE